LHFEREGERDRERGRDERELFTVNQMTSFAGSELASSPPFMQIDRRVVGTLVVGSKMHLSDIELGSIYQPKKHMRHVECV